MSEVTKKDNENGELNASGSEQQRSRRTYKDSNHILHQFKSTHLTCNIVFASEYDISFYKLENIHAFDCKKWGKIAHRLVRHFSDVDKQRRGKGKKKKCDSFNAIEFIKPPHPITDEELSVVHTPTFLLKMNTCKLTVVHATEVPLLCVIPMFLIRKHLLRPLRWQTCGSVLAAYVALKRGWAINLGGGFHHCCSYRAGGFCLYADITLCIRYLWEQISGDINVLIVDLDAHQGNGHARDVLSMQRKERDKVYILDMFNGSIYPGDEEAKEGISRMIVLSSYTRDDNYLRLLRHHLNEALNEFSADFIVYNAGTDILEGDPLGALSITAEGIKQRDETVFTMAKERNIPLVMLTSGGYQMNNAEVIANSIINLFTKQIIS